LARGRQAYCSRWFDGYGKRWILSGIISQVLP
jgi:hypothetical protein